MLPSYSVQLQRMNFRAAAEETRLAATVQHQAENLHFARARDSHEPCSRLSRMVFRSIGESSTQAIKKSNLPGLYFPPGGFVGEEARPIDFWKPLIFPGARRPFQLEQI